LWARHAALHLFGRHVFGLREAARVGFGDAVAFHKLFVRAVGLTPAEYRQRHGARTAPGRVGSRPRAG